eukprot:2681157-Prymnesium_polylepis.1
MKRRAGGYAAKLHNAEARRPTQSTEGARASELTMSYKAARTQSISLQVCVRAAGAVAVRA